MDWSEGTYEHTARELEPAAAEALDVLGITAGERVLDVGCGTGNAALEAARRGANVVGVDPAARLVEVAAARAAHEGLQIELRSGNAANLAFEDASFDAAISVFALIFADDADRAASEVARVVRPGGRVVLTTWKPTGAVHAIGGLVRQAAAKANPDVGTRAAPAWGDPAFIQDTLGHYGAITLSERTISFRDRSADAWLERITSYHPVWRTVGALVGVSSTTWQTTLDESARILREANEDPTAFCVTSSYLVVRIDLPQPGAEHADVAGRNRPR